MRTGRVLVAVALLMVMVLGSAAYAMEEQQDYEEAPQATENRVRTVSLDEALSIAMNNSITLELARLDLQEAEFNFRQAEASQIMRPSPVVLLQAQSGLDLARQSFLMAKERLSLTVKTDFFNVLRTQNLLEIAEEGVQSALRHEDIAQKKLAVGTATRLDVIGASRSVLNSRAGVSQARHGLELAQMKFRQTLGIPLEDPVLPQETPFSVDPVDTDLQADLAFALENRDEIKQLKVAVAVAEKNVELSDNDYTPAMTLEQAKINLAKMRAQFRQAKELLSLEIRQSHSALQDARERISVLRKGVEEAEEMIRLSELSYEADMITSNELADAQISLLSARNDLVNATFDYNLARSQYDNAVARALRDE